MIFFLVICIILCDCSWWGVHMFAALLFFDCHIADLERAAGIITCSITLSSPCLQKTMTCLLKSIHFHLCTSLYESMYQMELWNDRALKVTCPSYLFQFWRSYPPSLIPLFIPTILHTFPSDFDFIFENHWAVSFHTLSSMVFQTTFSDP